MDVLKEDLDKMYNSSFSKSIPKSDFQAYEKLEGLGSRYSKGKLGFLLIFIVCIVLISSQVEKDIDINKNLFSIKGLIFYYVIYLLFSVMWRFFVYFRIRKHYSFSNKRKSLKEKSEKFFGKLSPIEFLIFILSPDYLSASFCKYYLSSDYVGTCVHKKLKQCYKDNEGICVHEWERIKNAQKVFIELSNWINLLLTLAIIIFFLGAYAVSAGGAIGLLVYLISIRLFSRCFELVYAFYGDVVRRNAVVFKKEVIKDFVVIDRIYINGWKKTSIRKPTRISLAIHSLFEVVLLFSLIYFIIYLSNYETTPFIVEPEQNVNFLSFFLYSASNTNSISNLEFQGYFGYLQMFQVIVSLELILVSLATYLGLKEEMLPHENEFFKNYEFYKSNKENEGGRQLYDLINEYAAIKLEIKECEDLDKRLKTLVKAQEDLKNKVTDTVKSIGCVDVEFVKGRIKELGIDLEETPRKK